MILKNALSIILVSILIITNTLIVPQHILAADLVSPTYKLVEPKINQGSTLVSSDTYSSQISIGELSSDPQLYSPTYKQNNGPLGFIANVPQISCFETTTDGSSACTTGPAYLNTGGMVRVCGFSGCYDRARFEIDPQGNPDDTLYAVQISELSNFSIFNYISGTSGYPISTTLLTMADYKTETDWETPVFNILGIKQNQQYYLRIVALHGDFTESAPSDIETATTSSLLLTLDIDIANTTGLPASNSPYIINISIDPGSIIKSENLIWINTSTNSTLGITLDENGAHGGLYNGSSVSISSTSIDLATVTTGFGLQYYQNSQWYDTTNSSGNGFGNLSTLSIQNDFIQTFGGATEQVGAIPENPTLKNILTSDGPIYNGKTGLYVAIKTHPAQPVETLHENVSFILTVNY